MPSLLTRALAPASVLLVLTPSTGWADALITEPDRIARDVATFTVDVKPRQILSGRLSAGGRSRALGLSLLRSAARRGSLRVPQAMAPGRSRLRSTRLVILADVTPPSVPSGVSVQAAARTVVSWTRSKDDVGLRGYQVFRNGKRLTLTARTTFTDSSGGAGEYKVRAIDEVGNVSAFAAPPASPLSATGDPSWTCGWGTFDIDRLPGACWRPFADSSFLNTPLPPNPRLLSTSRSMIDRILTMGEVPQMPINPQPGDDWFHPYFFSRTTDPEYRVVCNKHERDCPVENMRVRIPPQARPADSEDGHMTVIDQATGWEWDFYNVQSVPLPADGGDIVMGWAGRTRIDGPGGGSKETMSPATMAALGSIGGIIRFPELAAGRIDHALFLVTGCSNGKMVFPGRDYGWGCRSNPEPAPASGQWLRLNMSEAEIAALPVSEWQKTILRALARYGGFVGDTGGNESIGFQIDSQETYEAIGKQNPWITWAKAQIETGDKNIKTWRDGSVTRYRLDVGERSELWETRLEVVDPCVIQRTC